MRWINKEQWTLAWISNWRWRASLYCNAAGQVYPTTSTAHAFKPASVSFTGVGVPNFTLFVSIFFPNVNPFWFALKLNFLNIVLENFKELFSLSFINIIPYFYIKNLAFCNYFYSSTAKSKNFPEQSILWNNFFLTSC